MQVKMLRPIAGPKLCASEGATIPVDDAYAAELIKGGYAEAVGRAPASVRETASAPPAEIRAAPAAPAAPAPAIEIPNDWKNLPWIKLQALVRSIGGNPKDKATAVAAVEAELAKRAAA